MDVPMTVERGPAQAAYDKGAADIAAALDRGQDVFVCARAIRFSMARLCMCCAVVWEIPS